MGCGCRVTGEHEVSELERVYAESELVVSFQTRLRQLNRSWGFPTARKMDGTSRPTLVRRYLCMCVCLCVSSHTLDNMLYIPFLELFTILYVLYFEIKVGPYHPISQTRANFLFSVWVRQWWEPACQPLLIMYDYVVCDACCAWFIILASIDPLYWPVFVANQQD